MLPLLSSGYGSLTSTEGPTESRHTVKELLAEIFYQITFAHSLRALPATPAIASRRSSSHKRAQALPQLPLAAQLRPHSSRQGPTELRRLLHQKTPASSAGHTTTERCLRAMAVVVREVLAVVLERVARSHFRSSTGPGPPRMRLQNLALADPEVWHPR